MLAPTIFRGSTAETATRWAALAARAWREGTWQCVLEESFADIDDTDGPIVLRNDDRRTESTMEPVPWSTDKDVWQFNWILECPCAPFEELVSNADRHRALVLNGMKHEWFAIGMLKADPRYLPFYYKYLYGHEHFWECQGPMTPHWQSAQFLSLVARPLLVAMHSHLPNLSRLDRRLMIASGRKGKEVQPIPFAVAIGFYLDLYMHLGLLQPLELASLVKMPSEKLVHRLMSIDVAE